MDEDDQELQELEVSIHEQTARITSLDAGPYGSLGSLAHLIRCLGHTVKNVVHVLLKSKDDIIGSEVLKELLHDYFAFTDKINEFLVTLNVWLNGASGPSWRVRRLKNALHEFKSDKTKTGCGQNLLQRALNVFMDAGDPLVAEQLRACLRAIVDAQALLYDRLRSNIDKIDTKNMKRYSLYYKVAVVVLASIYIGLMVCAAVTAALSPAMVVMPVMVLAAIANMNPVDYSKKCIKYLFAKYEEKIKMRRELLTTLMEVSGPVMLQDLEEVRVLVQALLDKIQSQSSNIAAKDSDFNTMIKNMEKKFNELDDAVKDLESKREKCCNRVTEARAKIIGTFFGRN